MVDRNVRLNAFKPNPNPSNAKNARHKLGTRVKELILEALGPLADPGHEDLLLSGGKMLSHLAICGLVSFPMFAKGETDRVALA